MVSASWAYQGSVRKTMQVGQSRLNAFVLSELVGRKWGGMLGKSSKESLFVPSDRDILGE